MLPKEVKGKQVLACSCGYNEKADGDMSIKETMSKTTNDIGVVGDSDETHPIADDETCPKCHNKGAYYWFLQTRSADEPETRFLRCTKCKHTWREYA